MKAVVMHGFGPPEMLRYEEVPDPVPRHGEVRIAVHAATVNRVLDVALRAGKQPQRGAQPPLIPGVDCAGVVNAVGAGVTRFKPGDRVAAAGTMPLDLCDEDGADYRGPRGMMGVKRPGGFAEMVVVPACACDALPQTLGFHDAAVVLRHCPTAWNLLCNEARLKPGEWLLVMGAAGNLGTVGIQIAKNVIGARVIATAGSDERVAIGLGLGADYGINYRTHDLRDEVLRITGGKGVDVVYDNIANPEALPKAFRALGYDGRLVTAGAHAGPNVTIDFFHLYDRRITIRGTPGHREADVPRCFEAVSAGKIKVQIAKVLPLSQAAAAHRMIEADPGMGKIVLDPMRG
ncbi:MAG TPA: zinc-binding dehydrogenase [Stellaceae bacterium]|nr:zinc-binding dehydrogenase [Stellaceae bacterium]